MYGIFTYNWLLCFINGKIWFSCRPKYTFCPMDAGKDRQLGAFKDPETKKEDVKFKA